MDYNQKKETLRADIEKAFTGIISIASVFEENNINEVPFPGSWTAGQVLGHIIKATGGIPDKQTIAAPRPYDEKKAQVNQIFTDYTKKLKSPDFVLPEDGPYSKEKLLKQLDQIKEKHLHTIDHSDLTALCVGAELPFIGELTRYEWLSFITVHVDRHSFQLRNIAKAMKLETK